MEEASRRAAWSSPAHESCRGDRVPAEWRRYSVPQEYERYTRAEHARWCQLLGQTSALVNELSQWLHPAYIDGLECLIRPWSRIPRLVEVDAALSKFGWNTVCVDGYIPPHVYAGMLSRGVFPISRSIRSSKHLDFSPVPDLAHDLLGHVPMLVSEPHRQFLRRLTAAMAAGPTNAWDHELYLANRAMGIERSAVRRSRARLLAAEARVDRAQRELALNPSVLTQLGRLYLWSIEFGLMGTPEEFRIYGAGLLSSPAETRSVCQRGAPIRHISLGVVHRDIQFSDPQSSYFVASDYAQLNQILTSLETQQATAAGVRADLGGQHDARPPARP